MNGLTKPRPSNTEPRVRSTPTKTERRLQRRQAAYDVSRDHGKTQTHRPGSQNRRNKG